MDDSQPIRGSSADGPTEPIPSPVPTGPDNDAELIERCRREIPYVTGAFSELVTRYEAIVYHTCLRYLGNEADAEEVTQDAFMKVFHGLEKFEGKSTFRTWLFRIVNNECASRYRRRKRREEGRRAYQVGDEQVRVTEPPDVEEGGLGGPIGAAMAALTESDRQVLVLRHVADLPIQEIADAVGIGLSAAKMRLYRAEERLREAYGRASDRPDV